MHRRWVWGLFVLVALAWLVLVWSIRHDVGRYVAEDGATIKQKDGDE